MSRILGLFDLVYQGIDHNQKYDAKEKSQTGDAVDFQVMNRHIK